ncbi:MAG: type II toxin-antitoxin system VapC family toxin [Planctomycetales bacterium]
MYAPIKGRFPSLRPWFEQSSSMRYLLDTNTCIAAMRQNAAVVNRLSAVSPGDCAISTITSYELFTGVEKCADPVRERSKVQLLLTTVCQLVFDEEAARESGRVRALLEAQGRMVGPYDILLAGHGLAAGLTVVTANSGEFSSVPALVVENWIQPAT